MLDHEVVAELSEGAEFWTMIVLARSRIAKAKSENDVIAAARAAAQYGAVVKRWRRYLIVKLTQIGLNAEDVSRQFVRSWQKRVFGQSVASATLAGFSDSKRSGGGRASNNSPGPEDELKLATYYSTTREKVKQCVRQV